MDTLIILFVLYILFGWILPAWAWGAVPLVLGMLMFFGGMAGIMASFRSPSPPGGLGSVAFAFIGVVLCVIGLAMSGHADLAGALLSWIGSIPERTVIIAGVVVGFVLAALANARR